MRGGKGDAEKARYWQMTIGEAARSGISIREFCGRRRLKREPVLGVAAQAEGGAPGSLPHRKSGKPSTDSSQPTTHKPYPSSGRSARFETCTPNNITLIYATKY